MRTYDEQYRQEVFNLIPEANWIAVDQDNSCFWYNEKPNISTVDPLLYWFGHKGKSGNLGKIFVDNWKDSLFERKWVPEKGERIFYVDLYADEHYCPGEWSNTRLDIDAYKNKLIFKTKEEAIARSKQLLGIKDSDMCNEWQEHGNK